MEPRLYEHVPLTTQQPLLALATAGHHLRLAHHLESCAQEAQPPHQHAVSLLLAAAWALSSPQIPEQQQTLRRLASRLQGVSSSLSAQLLLSLQEQWLVHLPEAAQQQVEAARHLGGRPLSRPFSVLTCYQNPNFSEDSLEMMERCLCQQYGAVEAFRRVESVLVRAKAWRALTRATLRWMAYSSDDSLIRELWQISVQCAGALAPDAAWMERCLRVRAFPWTAHEAAWVAHLLRQQQWSHLRQALPAFVHPSEDLVLRVHFASLVSQDHLDGSGIRDERQQRQSSERHAATQVSPQKAALDTMCARLAMLDVYVEEEQACLYATSLTHKGGQEAEIAWEGILRRRSRGTHVWESLYHAIADAEAWPLLDRLQRYLPLGRLPISHNPASFARLLDTHRQGLLSSVEMFDWLWLDFSMVPSDPVRFERVLVAFRARGDHKTCLRAWRLFGLSQPSAILRAWVWMRMAVWFEQSARVPWRGLTMAWMAWAWFPKDPLVLRSIWRRVRLFGLSHPLGRWCEEMAFQGNGDITWQIQLVHRLLLEKDGTQRAWRVFQKIWQRHPDHTELLQLGRQLALSLGLSKQALELSHRLLDIPESPLARARHLLGLASMLEDDKSKQSEALEAYRKAHRSADDHGEILWPFVDLLLRVGERTEALGILWRLFERSQDTDLQRALLMRIAAVSLESSDVDDDILQVCHRLFLIDGGFEDALFLLPEILARGVPARLLEILSQAQLRVVDDLQHAEISYWLAAVCFHLKDQARAIEFLQQIEAQGHRVPSSLLVRALSLAARFQAWMLLERLLKKQIARSENDLLASEKLPALYQQLGFFYEYTLRQPQQALSAYRLVLALSPQSVVVLERAETLCGRLERFDEQAEYLTRLLPKASDRKERARLLVRLAHAHARCERWPSALDSLREAWQADPEMASARSMIHNLEELLGSTESSEMAEMAKISNPPPNIHTQNNEIFPDIEPPVSSPSTRLSASLRPSLGLTPKHRHSPSRTNDPVDESALSASSITDEHDAVPELGELDETDALSAHETASATPDNATTAEHPVSSERSVETKPSSPPQSLPPIHFQEATIDEMRAPLAHLPVPAFLQEATIDEMRAPLAHLPVPSGSLPKENESFQTHTDLPAVEDLLAQKEETSRTDAFEAHPPALSAQDAMRTDTHAALPDPAQENAFSRTTSFPHAAFSGQHFNDHTRTDSFSPLPDPARTNNYRPLPDPMLRPPQIHAHLTQDDLSDFFGNKSGAVWVSPDTLIPQQDTQITFSSSPNDSVHPATDSGELDDPDLLPPLLSSDEHFTLMFQSSPSKSSQDALAAASSKDLPASRSQDRWHGVQLRSVPHKAQVTLEQIFALAERLHGGEDEQQNSAAEQIFQLVERLRQANANNAPKEQLVATVYNIAQLFQHTLQQAPMALLTYLLGLQICPTEDLFLLRYRELAPTWQRETQLLTELYLDVPSSTQPLHRLVWLCQTYQEHDILALAVTLLRYHGEETPASLPAIEENAWDGDGHSLTNEEIRHCLGDFAEQAEAATSLFTAMNEHSASWASLLPPLATHLANETLEPNHPLSRMVRRLSSQFGLPSVHLVAGESDTLAPALLRYHPPTFLLGDAFLYASPPEQQRFLLAKTMTQLLPPFRSATLLGTLAHLLLQHLPREIFPPAEIPIELWTLAERLCSPEIRQELPAPVVWHDTVERISSQIGLLATPSFAPALQAMALYAAGRLDRPPADFAMLIENFPPLHSFLAFAFSRQHLALRKKLQIPLDPSLSMTAFRSFDLLSR